MAFRAGAVHVVGPFGPVTNPDEQKQGRLLRLFRSPASASGPSSAGHNRPDSGQAVTIQNNAELETAKRLRRVFTIGRTEDVGESSDCPANWTARHGQVQGTKNVGLTRKLCMAKLCASREAFAFDVEPSIFWPPYSKQARDSSILAINHKGPFR